MVSDDLVLEAVALTRDALQRDIIKPAESRSLRRAEAKRCAEFQGREDFRCIEEHGLSRAGWARLSFVEFVFDLADTCSRTFPR